MKDLTSKDFWENYWQHKDLSKSISVDFPFGQLITRLVKEKKYKTSIEIGGYPGDYAIYFAKFLKFNSTLLDYVGNREVVDRLTLANGVDKKNIKFIKNNFFTYKSKQKYDLVFSLGFIEHFDNTSLVIKKHWELVSDKGTMIIALPNFLGINGVYQLLFDYNNFKVHNLGSMDQSNLLHILKALNISSYELFYEGRAMVWLENIKSRNIGLIVLTYILNVIGVILHAFGIRNKYLSTHIFIVARKSKHR